jgi:hypothetical protein
MSPARNPSVIYYNNIQQLRIVIDMITKTVEYNFQNDNKWLDLKLTTPPSGQLFSILDYYI